MKTGLIVTHNGNAHFDEFLALSLIIAVYKDVHFYIERREPSEEELNNPEVWVVDIGGRLQPEKHNFDHHQDLSIPASFVIVAEYLNVQHYLDHAPWWQFKDEIDRRGGFKMAEKFGLDSLDELASPLESFYLKMFAQSPISVYQQMKFFGRHLIQQGKRLEQQVAFWKSCQQKIIKDKAVLIGFTEETGGSLQFCDTLPEPPAIRITYDGRGDGWAMSTIKDADGVNFAILENHPLIKFAHKNGFLAKTKERIPIEEVYKLVEMAIE